MKIVIPAYEPDNNMLKLITKIIDNSHYEIVIVNDGSSISSNPIFEEAIQIGCTVLTHNDNMGKGAALKTAFSYILNNNEEEGIVCADCDGQHSWHDIQKIAEAIPFHTNALILGCRKFTNTVPLKSLIGNTITKGVFSLVSGNKISDTQTGLRGFSPKLLPWLVNLKGNRYEYEMNQLLEAKSSGHELYSIPIETIYSDNNTGSHFRPIRDSIKIYIPILKFSLSSLSCGLIDFVALFLLNWLSHNLLISVVGARIISSFCNYLLNKNIVFGFDNYNHSRAVLKYYLLVVAIMISNYIMLSFFTDILLLSLILSKIVTECILFIVSYLMQKKYVFAA